jgi:hypothetical protein
VVANKSFIAFSSVSRVLPPTALLINCNLHGGLVVSQYERISYFDICIT